MDEPLATAVRYNAVVAAANGSLWSGDVTPTPTPPPAPALPVVSIASASVTEGAYGRKTMAFTLTLSAAATTPVSVRWATANGTARSGSDYLGASGTVVFAAGQTKRTIGVSVIGDRFTEADETFLVKLSTPLKVTLSATAASAVGTILNDDGKTRAALASAFAMMSGPTTGSTATKIR
jgi:hypothetical protein